MPSLPLRWNQPNTRLGQQGLGARHPWGLRPVAPPSLPPAPAPAPALQARAQLQDLVAPAPAPPETGTRPSRLSPSKSRNSLGERRRRAWPRAGSRGRAHACAPAPSPSPSPCTRARGAHRGRKRGSRRRRPLWGHRTPLQGELQNPAPRLQSLRPRRLGSALRVPSPCPQTTGDRSRSRGHLRGARRSPGVLITSARSVPTLSSSCLAMPANSIPQSIGRKALPFGGR